jgi:hypothetical protein
MIQPAGRAARKYPPKNADCIKDDWKSVNPNAFFKCWISTSFRLTPIAHTKNKLVTIASGTMYRRSVTGAGLVICVLRVVLCQSTIQVHVPAIDK